MSDGLIPVRFRIAGSDRQHGELDAAHVESRGLGTWAVVLHGYVVTKDGEWEYEPQPSSRTVAFIARTRFASPEEALAAYNRMDRAKDDE